MQRIVFEPLCILVAAGVFKLLGVANLILMLCMMASAAALTLKNVITWYEAWSYVRDMLDQLPEEQRLTFTLHHFSDLSLPEVADIMHSSTATTKSRLRLAREKLQEKLTARGVVE